MKKLRELTCSVGLLLSIFAVENARGATLIISDNYNVTGSGSGFALNTGINSGINPPTTRLTGSAAASLRYINTGTKATTAYTIASSKLKVTSAANPGRFVLSTDGTTPFDFGPSLGVSAATPANPVVYDLSISMDNDSTGIQRFSFALGTAEGDANTWDFGFQVYRTASGNNNYVIGKRIDTAASGLASDLNKVVHTMGANTYGTQITILMRVTDAGSESSTYNSRVQLSLDGGSTWFYDTDTDSDLAATGWRLNGAGRVIIWDVAPDAGNVTYDNFSLNWNSGPRTWNGGGANGNWNNAANWGGAVPASGSALIFSGTTRQTNTNDFSGLTVPWLKINNGGFLIYGNAFTLGSALTNVTGNSSVNAAITLGSGARIHSDAGTLTLDGNITGGANDWSAGGAGDVTASGVISGTGTVTKDGAGTLQLSGASANTASGSTIVNAGTLSLAKTSGVNAISGNVTVGDGVGGAGADVLRLNGADQISDVATVTISSSGLFDLNGFSETIAGISGSSSGGQIALGSGTLTVNSASASTFAGVITGTGSLVKQGAGTLTLSGANTFSGNTTISAGTLAIGSGGSILSSPVVTLANGATLDLSGGYAMAASQTLVRDSNSGVGNVNGTLNLNSGATISLIADGTNGTVGTISVAGGLTLNNNTISINVTGGQLDVGTYSLINYTGAKSGSFNTNAAITGSGLAMGLTAKIVETSGIISLKVYVPAHGVSAASIKVTENDLGNTASSVNVTATTSINGLQVRDGSSRGDYTVQVGSSGTDDVNSGVLLTSVAENGRDHGEDSGVNYCTSALSLNSGGYFIPTATAPTGKEYNINVSAAFFPYSKWLGGYARNSGGTNGGANNLLTSSPGINLGTQFVDNGNGTSTVDLSSFGINSQSDGVLLAIGGGNNNEFANSAANVDGTWTIFVKDNGTNGAATTQGPVAFVFVPKTNVSVISGKFKGDGTILMHDGTSPRFSVVNTTNGIWQLSIPGYSPSKGVLVISGEGGGSLNQDNIVSFQPSGSNWIIQSRDLPGLGLQTPTEAVVSFVFIPAPTATLVSPSSNSTVSTSPTLSVAANSTSSGNVTVTFYGHDAGKPGPGPDFLIPVLPDTQNYAREASGSGDATKEMWFAQTDWIINHRVSDNIPFVATLGDCVNNADILSQWRNATNAYYRLEKQSSTLLLDGIPYGVTVGNHDQDPNGDENGDTTNYNSYFGTSHFGSKSYYGGHYGSNNDSWYDLFSAGGLDFLVISFEFGRYGDAIMDWARDVMASYPTRRVIVLTHYAGQDVADVNATTCPFGAQGQAIYTGLRTNANFFLMMSGHVFDQGGEGRRADTFQGHTVRTLVSDYQGRFNGGNGLMRLMYFSPSNNLVSVKTYSPYTGNYETDANSQFSFSYNMQPNGAGSLPTAYVALKTNVNVASGTQTSFVWSGLQASKNYEWYVTVTDEVGDYATSSEWKFSTTSGFSRPASADANGDGIPDDWESKYSVTNSNADDDGDGQSNYAEYIAHTNPTDAGSVLRIVNAKRDDNGQVTLSWASVGGTRYRIQYANGIGGEFTDIVRSSVEETDSSPVGEPATQTYTDTSGPTNEVRFYRVKVVPQE